MTRRNYSDAYDPDVTREDMGRPSRAEAEADAALDRRHPTPYAPGPLVDAVGAWRHTWEPGPQLDARIAAAREDKRRMSPTGTCHQCGKRVTGERKLCGICAARRDK